MKLRTRFLLLLLVILCCFVLASWFIARLLSQNVNEEWGLQLVQRQVMFDKYRTLSPLHKEIELAVRLAREPAIVQMALREANPQVRQQGVAVLEKYRLHFRDHSYFAAFANTGHYYFNDAQDQHHDQQLRYTLSKTLPADKWFYATMADKRDYQINLDPDVHLGVTKIWINVLIRDSQRQVLGVIGTGLDLTDFLKETVGVAASGVYNMFINQQMAIQLHNDPDLIDYMSVAKRPDEQSRVSRLLTRPEDTARLQAVMQQLRQGKKEQVETIWVEFQGEMHLLGVSWLPELGWFDLTLINPVNLMLADDSALILLAFASLFLLTLLVLGEALQRWVLRPVEVLRRATEKLQRGEEVDALALQDHDELGHLSRSFSAMAHSVQETQRELEDKVRQRTAELQRLTEIDPLTGLFNRRGLTERLERELARQARQQDGLGILLLDLDFFKQVNDQYGHAAGDVALQVLSGVLQANLREYDYAARWGGEEFLVVVPGCSRNDVLALAERIRQAVAALVVEHGGHAFSFTVSIGLSHTHDSLPMDDLLRATDDALYLAKAQGRNRVASL